MTIRLTAADPSGVSRVEFYIRAPGSIIDSPIGVDSSLTGYGAVWNADATTVDVAHEQAKRDRLCDALTAMGHHAPSPARASGAVDTCASR